MKNYTYNTFTVDGQEFSITDYKDEMKVYIKSIHPYDDADYHWALNKNGGDLYVIYIGSPGKKVSTVFGSKEKVARKLLELDKNIESRMSYESKRREKIKESDLIRRVEKLLNESEEDFNNVDFCNHMFGRLISDCLYFIQHPSTKHLWANDIDKQINLLKQCLKTLKKNGINPKVQGKPCEEENIDALGFLMKLHYNNERKQHDADHGKTESLNEAEEQIYNVEYNYGDGSPGLAIGHVKVRANSKEEALEKAEKYASNKHYRDDSYYIEDSCKIVKSGYSNDPIIESSQKNSLNEAESIYNPKTILQAYKKEQEWLKENNYEIGETPDIQLFIIENNEIIDTKLIDRKDVYTYQPEENEYYLDMVRDSGDVLTDYNLEPAQKLVDRWNERNKWESIDQDLKSSLKMYLDQTEGKFEDIPDRKIHNKNESIKEASAFDPRFANWNNKILRLKQKITDLIFNGKKDSPEYDKYVQQLEDMKIKLDRLYTGEKPNKNESVTYHFSVEDIGISGNNWVFPEEAYKEAKSRLSKLGYRVSDLTDDLEFTVIGDSTGVAYDGVIYSKDDTEGFE